MGFSRFFCRLLIKNGCTFADLKKICHFCTAFTKARKWKDGRVIDCTGLENRRTATYRGFESLSFRQQKRATMSRSFLLQSAPAASVMD
jgi:hypothetical protein